MAKDITSNIPLLTVGPAPHWHSGRTVPGIMRETIFALVPAAIMAVVIFGLDAARVIGLSCSVAVVTEALCLRLMGRDIHVDDYSALLTGLLFAFLLPAGTPWWLVAIGSFSTITLGKMAFGGLGGNPLSAVCVGWTLCRVSWPNFMNVDMTMLSSTLEYPLSQLKYLGVDALGGTGTMDMLLGQQLGGLGAVHVLALLAGGAFLIVRGHIRPHIPLAFLAGVALAALIFNAAYGTPGPVFHLLTGSVMLGAFFISTDQASSPVFPKAMIAYGLTAGALVVLIRVYGQYPDGVPFAILLANLLTPQFDRLRPKPFGAR